MMIDTGAAGLLFASLQADALTSPDQLRELYSQPNPNSLRKEMGLDPESWTRAMRLEPA